MNKRNNTIKSKYQLYRTAYADTHSIEASIYVVELFPESFPDSVRFQLSAFTRSATNSPEKPNNDQRVWVDYN